MRRGEIYRVYKPRDDPKRYRAFIIVSRQALLDAKYPTVICAPIYTNGSGLSTQVSIGIEEGLKHASWVHCDNLASIEKSHLTQYVGVLPRTRFAELDRALAMALDMRL
jgi:mRNA interferase MazF